MLGHDRSPFSLRAVGALEVLASSMVMVIGPTPPGTGVMSEATSFAESKSTSPHKLSVRQAVDADVDDHRARLDHVAGDHLRLAHRGDEDVGAAGVEGQVPASASGTP
jgi:hypothetical protein